MYSGLLWDQSLIAGGDVSWPAVCRHPHANTSKFFSSCTKIWFAILQPKDFLFFQPCWSCLASCRLHLSNQIFPQRLIKHKNAASVSQNFGRVHISEIASLRLPVHVKKTQAQLKQTDTLYDTQCSSSSCGVVLTAEGCFWQVSSGSRLTGGWG